MRNCTQSVGRYFYAISGSIFELVVRFTRFRGMKQLLYFFILIFLVVGCSKDEDTSSTNNSSSSAPCDQTHTQRVGAKCNDGTTSTATGSGACSHHGGVAYWLCK